MVEGDRVRDTLRKHSFGVLAIIDDDALKGNNVWMATMLKDCYLAFETRFTFLRVHGFQTIKLSFIRDLEDFVVKSLCTTNKSMVKGRNAQERVWNRFGQVVESALMRTMGYGNRRTMGSYGSIRTDPFHS